MNEFWHSTGRLLWLDMQTLLAVFDGLLAHGLTVVVVEHDRDLIAQRRPGRRRQARLRRAFRARPANSRWSSA